jgi:homoaconitase/3-isopropylmalate dehydratase large subunit
MTAIEKIFARKAGLDRVSAGDTVVVDVDMTVLIDLQFATMWIQPNRVHDPDKLAIVMDHAVPAPTVKDAAGGPQARKFAADFGIERFYDVGRHGICHQVIAENGLARPGEILACTDSHTCAAGAYNTRFGTGRGVLDHVHGQHLVPSRADHPLRTRRRPARHGERQGRFPAHRKRIRRCAQPESGIRWFGSGRYPDA